MYAYKSDYYDLFYLQRDKGFSSNRNKICIIIKNNPSEQDISKDQLFIDIVHYRLKRLHKYIINRKKILKI